MSHLKYLTIFDKTTGARATSLLFDADSADETKAAQDKAAKDYPDAPTMEMELGSEDWIHATSGYLYDAKAKNLAAPPEPTEDEKRQAQLDALDSEYSSLISDKEDEMARANAVGDSELLTALKEEREDLVNDYTAKREAI